MGAVAGTIGEISWSRVGRGVAVARCRPMAEEVSMMMTNTRLDAIDEPDELPTMAFGSPRTVAYNFDSDYKEERELDAIDELPTVALGSPRTVVATVAREVEVVDEEEEEGATVALLRDPAIKRSPLEMARAEKEAERQVERGVDAMNAGELGLARREISGAMALRRRVYGEDGAWQARALFLLAAVACREGTFGEAEWLIEDAKARLEQRLGVMDPRVAVALHNAGLIAGRRGERARGRALLEEALLRKVAALGWEHVSVARTQVALGDAALRGDEIGEAIQCFAAARQTFEACEGPMSSGLAGALMGLGRAQMRRGAIMEASFAFERALRIREATPCSPTALAASRFFLGMTMAGSAPDEACALVIAAVEEYQASPECRPRNLEVMRAWLGLQAVHTIRRAG